jgi:hypothetical protein
MARRSGDDVSWIAARRSSSPVCTPAAIDIIEISVRRRVALVLLGWHGRRLLRGVP